MKKTFTGLLLLLFSNLVFSQDSESCTDWPSWPRAICRRLHQIWTEGNNELYLSGYAWHNRYTYPRNKIHLYNEQAWGGGLGKGLYDEKGNWQGIFAFGFLDSHKNLEPVAGYAFLKVLHLNQNMRIGAGYTILATMRPDIFHGYPFPGVLPWVSINYRSASLSATYIPGAKGAGNVLYVVGKWTFNFL